MFGTVDRELHARMLQEVREHTQLKTQSWVDKFDASAAEKEDELLARWKQSFEELQSANDELVDTHRADPDALQLAQQFFIQRIQNQLLEGAKATGQKSDPTTQQEYLTPNSSGASPSVTGFESVEANGHPLALFGATRVGRSKSTADDKLNKSLKSHFHGVDVEWHIHEEFRNWGNTVANIPNITFEPRSRRGVQEIVRWARANGKRVRACGYRHTWTNMYSDKDQVLISMIPVSVGTDHCVLRPRDKLEGDLQSIEFVKEIEPTRENGVTTRAALIKIGASTSNEQFRYWCLSRKKGDGNWNWTLPLNVIMVEITFGGSNAPICHGAGIKHQTLSDLVHEIEFVNIKGEIQRVSDPAQLRAASGAFGLLGIVTAVTLRVEEMSYACMKPTKTSAYRAVPPLHFDKIPAALSPAKMPNPEEMKGYVEAFERHCSEDYYAEWFWFPLQKKTWNNCWKATTAHASEAKPMSETAASWQGLQGILGQVFNGTFGQISGSLQTHLLAESAMAMLPNHKEVHYVPVIDALHFRRGINNMRVLDMELEIPIPDNGHGQPDWSICRRAWWDIISLVYKHEAKGKYPMRIALEMRIMGGSNVIMAPQYGNEYGTCSIEVLSTPQVNPAEWNAFMQEVADIWYGYQKKYKDSKGQPINIRSHWAKQWESLTVDKVNAVEYFRSHSYKDRIPEFLEQLRDVAQAGGYELSDLKDSFSTPLLDRIFFDGTTGK